MIWFPWMVSGQWLWLHDFLRTTQSLFSMELWDSLYTVLLYLLYVKMEASLLDVFFFWNVFDSLMISSHLALSETLERHLIMFILNLHSFCCMCEVQVNWSQTLRSQLVTTGFVTHWLGKKELEGRRKTCKEGILRSQQNKGRSVQFHL